MYELQEVTVQDRRMLYSGVVPLSPTPVPNIATAVADEEVASARPPMTTLAYVGFSDEAVPLVLDSQGVLFGLLPVGTDMLRWLPLLDFARAKIADPYIVSCSDKEVTILSNEDDGPLEQISQTVKLPLELPLLDIAEDVQRNQEVLLRSRAMRRQTQWCFDHGLDAAALQFVPRGAPITAAVSKLEAEHEKELMQLFACLVQNGELDRAFDVAKLSLLAKTAPTLVQVAEHFQQQALRDALAVQQATLAQQSLDEQPTPLKRPRQDQASVEKVARTTAALLPQQKSNMFAVASAGAAPMHRVLGR